MNLRTMDDGDVVGFTSNAYNHYAVVRYGARLQVVPLDEVTLVDDDTYAEGRAWERSRKALLASGERIRSAVSGSRSIVTVTSTTVVQPRPDDGRPRS